MRVANTPLPTLLRRGILAYDFDPSDVQVIADLIDRVATPKDDPMETWERLMLDEEYRSLDEGLRVETDFLFTYELQEDYGSAGEVKLVESGLSFTATRPMSETPSTAWTLWGQVVEILQSPGIRAHLADILLTARVRPKPEHAASTISLYLMVSDLAGISALQAALSLARANFIARSRGMNEELAVRAAMHRRSEVLGNDPESSGPALTLLAALSVPPRGGKFEPGEGESVRTRLVSLGELSPGLISEIAKTLARLSEGARELELARRWHVEQYLSMATSEDHGMRTMHHAQTAADLASDYGLVDLKDAAILVMQSVAYDSMGWETVATEGTISKNAFRAHLRRYRRARNWDYALMVFLAGHSPSGDHEANIKSAKQAATGSIRSVISRTVYGSHGLPERSNADFMTEEIAQTETITVSISAILLALELEFVRDRFSPPPADQIADWMVDSLSADAAHANQFSKSLALHWAESYSDSARLSIQLIESAARGLLLTLDEPLYRTERGDSPGRFPALDFYVEALAKRDLDPDWVRALRVTLLSPGMNLRNLAAHGFMMDFSAQQSALLLRLAGLFCAMPVEVDQATLESPPNVARRRLRRRLGWVWS